VTRLRMAAIVLGAADCVFAAVVAIALFGSGSDPATKGLNVAAGWLAVILLLVSGLPGLLLALPGRYPKIALALTLIFPVGFVLLLIAAVIAFA
jgi:hypothetical protein